MLNLFRGYANTLGFQSLINTGKYGFATKMQAGSTQNKKDSAGRRLGVKKLGGHEVYPDDILVRQRGFRWHPGKNTYSGRDHTIHSKVEGVVNFRLDPYRKRKLYYVDVEPRELPNRKIRPPPPYVYHPELFPERATANPEPTNFEIFKPRPVKVQDPLIHGRKVEKAVHRVSINIPEHYINAEPKERVTTDQLAYEKVRQLERDVLGWHAEEEEGVEVLTQTTQPTKKSFF